MILKHAEKINPKNTVPIAPPIYPSNVFLGDKAIKGLFPKILPNKNPQASLTNTKKIIQINQNLL